MSGLAASFAPDPTPARETDSPKNGKTHHNGNGKSRGLGKGPASYSSEDEANFTGELLETDLMLLADLAPELDQDLAFLATLELDEEPASFPELEAVVEAELDEAVSILDLEAEAEGETLEEPATTAEAEPIERPPSVATEDTVEDWASVPDVDGDADGQPPADSTPEGDVSDDVAAPQLFTSDPEARENESAEAADSPTEAPGVELALSNGHSKAAELASNGHSTVEASFLATLFTNYDSDKATEKSVEKPTEAKSVAINPVRPQLQAHAPAPPRNRRWRVKTPLVSVILLILMTGALAGVVSLRSLTYQPRRTAPAQAIAPPVAPNSGSIQSAPPAVAKSRDCSQKQAHAAKPQCDGAKGSGAGPAATVSFGNSTPTATPHVVRHSNRPHQTPHRPGGSGGSGGGQPQPGTGGSGGGPNPDDSSGKPGCGNGHAYGWQHQAKEHGHPDHPCPNKKTDPVITGRMA